MMATDNHDNRPAPPEDPVAIQADARLRELLSSLPVSATEVSCEHRVLAKVHRRQMATRATYGASLIVLLTAGWLMLTHGRDSQHPILVGKDHSPADALDSMDEVELFAVAYHGLSSPVAQLDLEDVPRAWLRYLSSPEATMEKK